MKSREYVFVLIASLALVLAVAGFEYTGQVFLHSEDKNAPSALYDLQEPLQKIDQLTAQLDQRIAKLDTILAAYERENERLELENESMAAQLRDFGQIMDDIGARAQREYERTH